MKSSIVSFMTKGILATTLLLVATVSCTKWTQDDLIGTWQYDDQPGYTVTFKTNGTLGYTVPSGEAPQYTPSYVFNNPQIVITVQVGSYMATEIVEVRSLNKTNMVIYYEGDILFEGKSVNGEYSLTKK